VRDPKRIGHLLSLINDIWTANPDLRLCQLISNCFESGGDLYHVEDDNLVANLKIVYKGRFESKKKRK